MTVKKMPHERSKIFAIGITFILVMTVIPFTTTGISKGRSTICQNEPIEISTVEELQAMRDDLEADYVLENDIDASATREWNDGAGFEPIGTGPWDEPDNHFTGSFDRQSHTITGLYIYRPNTDYVGIFGFVGSDGEVRNVGVVNAYVSGNERVGGLVGSIMVRSTVTNSYATGDVSGTNHVGGFVWREL